ncbi:MAG: hypothetical protein ACK47B_07205 [Armatimonadota bacterium]
MIEAAAPQEEKPSAPELPQEAETSPARRGWTLPAGLVFSAAVLSLAAAATAPPRIPESAASVFAPAFQLEELPGPAARVMGDTYVEAPELMGPPAPEAPKSVPNGPAAAPAQVATFGGPVRGPLWSGTPLPWLPSGRAPAIPAPGTAIPVEAPRPAEEPQPTAAAAKPESPATSSELPDPKKLALSRLARPELETLKLEKQAGKVSAAEPLRVELSLAEAGKTVGPGDSLTVRLAATAACYLALIRVDASGKAATAFRAPLPSQRLSLTLKAGAETGAEYLLAVASVKPLSGAQVSAALKASGNSFPTVQLASANSGAAWNAALAHAGALSGPAARWERFEWAVDTAAVAVRAPEKTVAVKPAPEKPAPEKPASAAEKPSPGKPAESVLPEEKLPEKAPADDGSALPD